MKYGITLLAFICSSLCSFAQPVLTIGNVAPLTGDGVYYYNTSGGAPGPSGAAQTWNFAGINSSNSYRGDYAVCSASPHCGSFPGSGITRLTPGVHYFMSVNSDSLYTTGTWYDRSVDVAEVFHNPHTFLRFPFTYGDSYVDSFGMRQIVLNDTLTRNGSDSTIADGWGTLLIKNGTVPGVLRIKKVLTMEDRIDTGGTPIIFHTRAVLYYWYVPGYHEYLLYTGTIYTDAPFLPAQRTEGGYTAMVNGSGTGVEQLAAPMYGIENPVREQLHVSLNQSTGEPLEWRVVDLQGRKVRNGDAHPASGQSRLSIPLGSLAPGLYLLSLRQGSQQSTQRFVVQ